jgi:hypothetical protein
MTFDNSKENEFGEHPGQWALDSLGDVLENDPLRLLDMENDVQMGLNKLGLPSETDRATSNFEDLVFDTGRPFRDNYTEFAGRAIPFLLTAAFGPVVKGSKVGLGKLNKLINNKKVNKAFQRAANKQLKNITDDPTVIKNVNKMFSKVSKPVEYPPVVRVRANSALLKAKHEGVENALNYLDDIADIYTNPVSKYVADKSKNLVAEGKSIDQIRDILKNEARSLANSSGIDAKDVNNIIDTLLNKKQFYQNFTKIARETSSDIKRDIFRNKNVYKQFAADNKINYNDIEKLVNGKIPIDKFKDWDKLKDFHNTRYIKAQDTLSKLNKATIPEVNKPLQPEASSWENIMSKLKPTEVLGPSVATALVTKAPEFATTVIENKLDNKPEYTWKNALGDTLKDMLGLDWSNPERFNEHEVNQYLQWAEDVGLMSSDQWNNWTPREKLLKVKQIADFAREFDNTGDDYDYKTLYGDTRKEMFKRK